jgi:polar amino acid transport system ATP-binding protein
LEGVYKTFGDNPVLRGIDLEVHQHQVVVLIGASGSGKSTLLRSINLLEQIDDGQIFLTDQDISDPRIDVDKTRARIGVVFQQFNLFPHLTVLDNVTLANRRVHGLPKADAEQVALQWLDRIGLREKVKDYPDRLSGGQQQRVAIVRALASNPELLLLDEITSALDPQLVGEVLDLVFELKASGSTILMATHEMSFARKAADRVIFLKNGVLVEQGTPEQIFDHPEHPDTREFLARVHSVA